jgi:DNA-binding CsgD family transcriptional regulator
MISIQSRLLGIYSEKDKDSVITDCDELFLKYTGVKSKDDIVDHTDFDFVWQEYAPLYRKHELDILSGNQYSAIIPAIDAEGNTLIFLHNKIPKVDCNQNIIGIVAHAVEIFNPNYSELIHGLMKRNFNKTPVYSMGKNAPNLHFTPRERECLFYLLYGKTAKAIARILNISPRTAETHIEKLKVKFGCHTKMELIDAAIDLGFLNEIPGTIKAQELVQGLKE